MNKNRLAIVILLTVSCTFGCSAQSFDDAYNSFRQSAIKEYISFRDECNRKYAEFLRGAWEWYEGKAPLPLPKEESPVPPRPYGEDERDDSTRVETVPLEVTPIEGGPQPKPFEPIREVPDQDDEGSTVDFYELKCRIRLPESARIKLADCSPNSIASGWERLSDSKMNNAMRDCLETRIRYNLCDWAYLQFLDELGRQYCDIDNGATLLTAFLYCQSGYQMRLAMDGDRLVMLYGSRHQIFDKPYFEIDGTTFYPLGEVAGQINLCNAAFEGETPMSLVVGAEQLLGSRLSDERLIKSDRYSDVSAVATVSHSLIDFFNRYPTSMLDGNPMTRWAIYANTPLSKLTKERLYASLNESIKGLSEKEAVNRLLNWVQTGFVYEYDEKIWGRDRAFFAEESLFYPYCDCEDRSILFSQIVRDLVGIDVALIYYPGHLATAVRFNSDVDGDAMIIDGRKYIVCDPTYIGAPVGAQMPNLEYDKAQAIVLER